MILITGLFILSAVAMGLAPVALVWTLRRAQRHAPKRRVIDGEAHSVSEGEESTQVRLTRK